MKAASCVCVVIGAALVLALGAPTASAVDVLIADDYFDGDLDIMEAELADWVKENNSRLPIVAFMAGRFMDEMPGMRFGHAGTIVEGKADTTADKIERMRAAGIAVAERIEEIPDLIREGLGEAS